MTGVLKAYVNGQWIAVGQGAVEGPPGPSGPAGPPGSQGPQGVPGPQAYVGPTPPTDPELDLWWDTTDDGSNAMTQTLGDARYHRSDELVSDGEMGADAAGPTVGTTALTVDTITVPNLGPGRVHVWSMLYIDKTVATDRFFVAVSVAGSVVGQAFEIAAPNASRHQFIVSASTPITGSALINVDVARLSGTGTAAPNATASAHTLHYIFIPTAS